MCLFSNKFVLPNLLPSMTTAKASQSQARLPTALAGLLTRCRTIGVCLLLMLTGVSCDMTPNETREAYHKVKVNLLSHPYAVEKIPPKVLIGENIDILIGFAPQKILSVNEVDMTVTLTAIVTVSWSEPAFAWDSTNNSIEWVSVPVQDLWTPILLNALSVDTDDLVIRLSPLLRVHHTGLIITVQMAAMTVSCSFDMEWFPFDEQRCSFPFLPINADTANVNTVPAEAPPVSVPQVGDWSWEEVIPKVAWTEDAQKNFTFVRFEVLMRRRGLTFYLTNIVLPMAASALLTLGVFIIPPDSGEKISYLVSIFISTSVFLSSLPSIMSKGQGNICRFNVFVVAITVEIVLATAATILVLNRYTEEQEKEQEVMTSLQAADTEDVTSTQRRHRRPVPSGEVNYSANKEISGFNNIPPSHAKLDAFERPVSALDNSRCTQPATKVEREVTGIRRYWTRGCRLSSTELDRMFFVMFTVVTVVALACIMHAR